MGEELNNTALKVYLHGDLVGLPPIESAKFELQEDDNDDSPWVEHLETSFDFTIDSKSVVNSLWDIFFPKMHKFLVNQKRLPRRKKKKLKRCLGINGGKVLFTFSRKNQSK